MKVNRCDGWRERTLTLIAAVGVACCVATRGAEAQVVTPPAGPTVTPDTLLPRPPVLDPNAVADQLAAEDDSLETELASDSAGSNRPPLDAETDSIFQYLRGLAGYTPTEYEGNNAEYRTAEGTLRLLGDARVERPTQQVTADTILVNDREKYVEAIGSPRVESEGQSPLDAERIYYDIRTQRAFAPNARTELTEQATWIVNGDITTEGNSTVFVEHGRFTSCDLTVPHYHFQTGRILVHRGKVLVATSAKLYFGNVPVMWLPFVVQNLEKGRRSGLLTPRFGLNDIVRSSSGYRRMISDVGYYWAINQYMGAQVSSTWRSGSYTAVRGTFDLNWKRQFLNANVTTERFFEASGGRQLSLNSNASWRPDEVTSVSIAGGYASSSSFVRQSSIDPREVTQNLNSSINVNRTFSWGQISLGGTRQQQISSGDVSMTLPNFSISRKAITLFQAASPDDARWYNGVTINLGSLTGTRSSTNYADNKTTRQQDRENSNYRISPSITVGNITIGGSADLTQTVLKAASGTDLAGNSYLLPESSRDEGSWAASTGYRLALIGSTSVSPNVSLSQNLRRDTLTAGKFIQGPTRLNFGAALATDIYGFFPGLGNFEEIRHRVSPSASYTYSPEVKQTPLQELVFGRAGGRTQSRISFGVNQTFEARLRTPPRPEQPAALPDSVAGDSIQQASTAAMPSEPAKVTLLSLTTSAFDYDFIQAREEGTGFQTTQVSNTIRSDFLRGLSIQTRHELFDQSDLNPALPQNQGKLGRFSPKLASLSTSFELGPQTALIQWVQRLFFGPAAQAERPSTLMGNTPPSNSPTAPGQGAFTGNPQDVGGGAWRVSLSYDYNRIPRVFNGGGFTAADPVSQTLRGMTTFQLSPNWSVNWATDYSITDNAFGTHNLGFRRDLHEWQAHFNFYQTPTGNTGFEFYVQLQDNQDLRFDYSERNLGIDRPQ